jgi:hypothetical protein
VSEVVECVIYVVSKKYGEWYQKTNKTGLQAPDLGGWVGGLLSVSLPKEHHEKRTFCRRGSNPNTCDSGSAIDS